MSRNLYKLIEKLEQRIAEQDRKIRLLENNVDHLETLLRLKDKCPERPIFPQVWLDNNDSITKTPYKFTCKVEPDSLTKIFDEFFK